MTKLSLIGERLKEQRNALGLSQADIADKVGISREHWGRCERGGTVPGGEVLAALALLGADVVYILTGRTQGGAAALRDGEATLLEGFRALDARGKAGVMALIGGMGAAAAPRKVVQRIDGASGSMQVGYVGNFNQAPQAPLKGKRK